MIVPLVYYINPAFCAVFICGTCSMSSTVSKLRLSTISKERDDDDDDDYYYYYYHPHRHHYAHHLIKTSCVFVCLQLQLVPKHIVLTAQEKQDLLTK